MFSIVTIHFFTFEKRIKIVTRFDKHFLSMCKVRISFSLIDSSKSIFLSESPIMNNICLLIGIIPKNYILHPELYKSMWSNKLLWEQNNFESILSVIIEILLPHASHRLWGISCKFSKVIIIFSINLGPTNGFKCFLIVPQTSFTVIDAILSRIPYRPL